MSGDEHVPTRRESIRIGENDAPRDAVKSAKIRARRGTLVAFSLSFSHDSPPGLLVSME